MLHLRAATLAATVGLALLFIPGRPAEATTALLVLDPQQGPPGTTVRVTPMLLDPAGCVAIWDDQAPLRFKCGPDGSTGIILSTELTVPADASPGPHTITVCQLACGSKGWEQSTPFVVLSVVPDLGKLGLPAARARLDAAGLALGRVQGPSNDPAAVVVGQDPAAGKAVDPKSLVNVTLAVPTVKVPDLTGKSLADARATVKALGLVLKFGAARTGLVASQKPVAGSLVRPGSTVTVTVAVVPPPTSPTPSRPTETPSSAAASSPPATPTPTVSSSPAASSRSTTTLATVAAVALALTALATSAAQGFRRRRSPRWVHQHVRVDPGGRPGQTHTSEAGSSLAVGLEPHPDRGSQTVEEVHR